MQEKAVIVMIVRYLLLIVVLVTPITESRSEELQLSLDDTIRTALENNHNLLAGKSGLNAEKSKVGIEKSFLLPKLSLEERFSRTNNPTNVFSIKLNQERFAQTDFNIDNLNNPDAVSDFQTNVTFEQPVIQLKRFFGLKIANRDYLASEYGFQRNKEEIVYEVIDTYLLVQTAKEFIDVNKKSVSDAREHLRIAEERFKQGLGLMSDKLRTSTALTGAEQKLVTSEKDLKIAKRALGLLIGEDQPVDTTEESLNLKLRDIEYYVERSTSRNDLKSMKNSLGSAHDAIRMADSAYIPDVGLMGSYQLNDENTPFGDEGTSWFISAYLRWNIFDGWKREYERAEARHNASRLEHEMNYLKDSINFNVHSRYLEVEEAAKNLELARKALKTASEGARLVNLRYENSLSPLVDLLDAQLNLDNARAEVVARENEYKTAVARLNLESGTLFEELNLQEDVVDKIK